MYYRNQMNLKLRKRKENQNFDVLFFSMKKKQIIKNTSCPCPVIDNVQKTDQTDSQHHFLFVNRCCNKKC